MPRTDSSLRWWRRQFGPGVFGVVHRIDDQLADMFVFQAVEDRGALAAGAHQPRHPQLGQMLRYRWRGLAQLFGEFVDRQLTARERPQHPDPGGVGQHPEHFDDQVDLVFGNRQPERHYLRSYADNSLRRNNQAIRRERRSEVGGVRIDDDGLGVALPGQDVAGPAPRRGLGPSASLQLSNPGRRCRQSPRSSSWYQRCPASSDAGVPHIGRQ